MPDEIQQSGTSTETSDISTAPEASSPSTEAPDTSVDSSTPTETPPLDNTVGAALELAKAVLGNNTESQYKVTLPAKTQPPSRSFDGLEPEEAELFKRMSNAAYNRLYPIYKEYKELKPKYSQLEQELNTAKSSHFYEQENAYQLTPDYANLSQAVKRIGNETRFWEEQLIKVRTGQEWTPLLETPEGKIIVGTAQAASPEAEAIILSALTKAHTLSGQLQNQLSSFPQNFRQKHGEYLNSLKGIEGKIFGGVDATKLNELAAAKLQMFPTHVQGRPEVNMLAKALVIIDGLLAMARQQKSTSASAAVKAKTASAAGPTSESISTGGATGTGLGGSGKVGDILDDMRKFRATNGLVPAS